MYNNSKFIDDYRHRGLRKKLIAELRTKGIYNETVLDAFNQVPRHFFLDKAFEELSYQDRPVPIGNAQTISQPYTVALQSQLLNVQKRDKILEIGTGSGFQACILAAMGAKVYTIERQEELYRKTNQKLTDLGFSQIKCFLKMAFSDYHLLHHSIKLSLPLLLKTCPTNLLINLLLAASWFFPKAVIKNKKWSYSPRHQTRHTLYKKNKMHISCRCFREFNNCRN
jgi:hypothetical protein